jgi:hypothetical protein
MFSMLSFHRQKPGPLTVTLLYQVISIIHPLVVTLMPFMPLIRHTKWVVCFLKELELEVVGREEEEEEAGGQEVMTVGTAMIMQPSDRLQTSLFQFVPTFIDLPQLEVDTVVLHHHHPMVLRVVVLSAHLLHRHHHLVEVEFHNQAGLQVRGLRTSGGYRHRPGRRELVQA